MKTNNFDGVAFIYDALAKFFFRRSLKRAQTYFIKNIPPDASILILGSGTGWIAEEIFIQKPYSKITLVDASQKMTAMANQKLKGKPVEIFCADHTKVFSTQFDVVVLPCFLDLFPDQKLYGVIDSIKISLKSPSLWMVTDFVARKKWQQVYLWGMYRFFKWTCNIEAKRLPDWETILSINGFEILLEKTFYKGFIKSVLARRNY